MAVDLHLHTTHSDGSLSPAELISLLKEYDVNTFAITDHDTISAIEEADQLSRDHQMRLIPGVELSIEYPLPGKAHLHLLGLFIDIKNPDFKAALQTLREERKKRARLIVQKLREIGILLPPARTEELEAKESVGRPHIARLLLHAGLVHTMEEAFQKYIGRNAPAYVPKKKFQLTEAINLIHKAGGLAVVAHPVSLGARTYEELRKRLNALLARGIDGLEAYYSLHDSELTAFLLQYARENELVVSGGSDFHGEAKKEIKPVIGTGNLAIPETIISQLDAFHNHKYGAKAR